MSNGWTIAWLIQEAICFHIICWYSLVQFDQIQKCWQKRSLHLYFGRSESTFGAHTSDHQYQWIGESLFQMPSDTCNCFCLNHWVVLTNHNWDYWKCLYEMCAIIAKPVIKRSFVTLTSISCVLCVGM